MATRRLVKMGDEALVHLAADEIPGIDVLFIDTGYHFAETLGPVMPSPRPTTSRHNMLPLQIVPNRTRSTVPTFSPAIRTNAARCARSSHSSEGSRHYHGLDHRNAARGCADARRHRRHRMGREKRIC